MALLIQFGPQVGPIPTSQLDTMFDSVAQATVIKCLVGGSGNTIVLTPANGAPTLLGYSANQYFSFVAGSNNTGNTTVNIQSLGAIPVLQAGGSQLPSGTIQAGNVILIATDGAGSAWVVNSKSANATSINGVAVGGGVPTDGQVITYVAADSQYEPQDLPSDIAYFDRVTQWTKQVAGAVPVALTDASNVAWDMSRGNTFQLSATSAVGNSRTLAAATSAVNGDTGVFVFIQDGVGGRAFTATSGNGYAWPNGTQATGSTGTGSIDIYGYTVRLGKIYMACIGSAFA